MKKPNGPVFHIMLKEFREVKRSVLLKILLVAPIFMSLIFGFVATTDIKHVPVIICDEDNTAMSRQMAEKFVNNELFKVKGIIRDPALIEKTLVGNKAKIIFRIPRGFTSDVKRGRETVIQILLDGSDSNSTMTSLTRALAILRTWSAELYGDRMVLIRTSVGKLPSVRIEERVWFNPELKSANMMVPGLIGVILAVITVIVTSVSLVREKESGNIEQLNVTPVKPWQIITGKILPYVAIAFIDIITLTVMCALVFKIPLEGSIFLLFTFSIFMILANLGIGIFISTISKTQQQAMMAAIFVILPSMLLSGLIFAIRNMPDTMQILTYLIPMRYFMVIVRGIFLKGLGFMELWPQAAALFIYSLIIFTLAILRFKKKTM